MEIRPAQSTLKPSIAGIERDAAAVAPSVPTSAPAAVQAEAEDNVNGVDLRQAVERINQSLPPSNQGIEFAIDEDSERVVVKVVDRETREVLRQMPTREALDIAKALDRTQGLLIKLEA